MLQWLAALLPLPVKKWCENKVYTPLLCFFPIVVNPWILSHHESQIKPNDWLATAALPRWYLKYFSEASNNGPVEAFYASYMPDVQRANKLDLIQPKDTWVLAKRNPPGRASNKIHKPFLASMLFSKVHIVDGITFSGAYHVRMHAIVDANMQAR